MIKSDIVRIRKVENFDNSYIENELKASGMDVVRWAIVKIEDDFLILSVSFVTIP